MQEQFKQFLDGIKNIYPQLKAEQEETETSHIAEIEKRMDVEFNEELRNWFQMIGKAEYGVNGLLVGLEVYDIDDMFEEWKSWREFDNDSALNNSSFYSSQPIGAIKCSYTNPKWIPLAHDYSGNYIGADLDPDENGVVGQIINFGRDEEAKKVFANSIKEFLHLLVQYQDEMEIDDTEEQASYINEDEIHPIDWLKGKMRGR